MGQDDKPVAIQLDNISDIEVLKYSSDPSLRKQYFELFCRACSDSNSPVVAQICTQRLLLARHYGQAETFWNM